MNIYEKIKQENKKRYGTDIGRVGTLLLSNLYSERTHFIYELLQNAEDACERARQEGKQDFTVKFELFPDRLEFRHNGIQFNERDVQSICGINEEIKSGYDEKQIGKFGIGFKSVFAYTKCPEIYSGEMAFCIENYVWPKEIEKREDVNPGETLIVIPFHEINLSSTQEEINPQKSFEEIKEKLGRLGLRMLLFTKNISAIEWVAGGKRGNYKRKQTKEDDSRWVQLSYNDNDLENWLVFEKYVKIGEKKALIEVGYKVETEKNKKKIVKGQLFYCQF